MLICIKNRGQLEQNMILHVEPSLRHANIMWIKQIHNNNGHLSSRALVIAFDPGD